MSKPILLLISALILTTTHATRDLDLSDQESEYEKHTHQIKSRIELLEGEIAQEEREAQKLKKEQEKILKKKEEVENAEKEAVLSEEKAS